MIEPGVKLIEMLIELFDRKHIKKEKFFKDYVQPTYQLAEKVYGDYLKLFENVKRKLKDEDSIENIIRFLEEGRVNYLPVRAKLRAILRRYDECPEEEMPQMVIPLVPPFRKFRRELPRFERGILGILRGGLASLEDIPRVDLTPYGDRDNHTLLDVLYHFSEESVTKNRSGYLRLVEEQVDALKKAWEDVVEGFVQHQKKAIRGL